MNIDKENPHLDGCEELVCQLKIWRLLEKFVFQNFLEMNLLSCVFYLDKFADILKNI